MNTLVFGKHIMVDAYDCDPLVLDDPKMLTTILDELIRILKMHKLSEPMVLEALNNGHKDPGGWTGFVIIAESHISCHTFVKRKFATLDIYSCKEFDSEEALAYLKKVLKTDDLEVFEQQRGNRYPAEDLI